MTHTPKDPRPPAPEAAASGATQLSARAQAALTFQVYAPPTEIAGVWLKPLKKHRGDNGAFMEYLRLDEGAAEGLPAPFTVRQLSVSHAQPGRINAFHIHPREPQNELWTVIQGQLKVWLVDLRATSPTEGNKRAFILSGEEPAQLFVPAGVAHGYQAGPEGALLLYTMDQQFNAEHPNEGRLPWDFFGAELWAEDRG
ncbi:dTDP-4-dehydrorhamnose 3,5-epimerase family protein [Truepera radiovictrix]|uniref:dTDP-4-dehydrorhamnose 35-epimerase related protein n=1 Tax=Truepera radiovictrix (strain DSM 17093 / CIP 108686 / LMG 22925 / RQ-24) TaxID=649638 RepID=D7CVQ6_TRURR|nr:dTDP-4-dehydrorhamnose 3,5-epimerase family protein [Truepera radiovictrix]ADI15967.1 dTDP-4-dehydrorhamnose 35-epimerase related protein [Truepera radiovictrix DSM 17093]WMT58408.1 dTDP-4-dehydrorhamnose 3,5-epimerase family protein [Truepera radiovictrix]